VSVTDPRLRAVALMIRAQTREYAGWHDLDGTIQDLSPEGVAAGLAAVGTGELPDDPVDAAILQVTERSTRVAYGELALHRTNPYVHLANLDVASYDREYAPAPEREAARARHLAAWPDAVDMAVRSLDAVPAPAAQALLPSVRGLAASVSDEKAQAAVARLVAHLEHFATDGDPDPALGEERLLAGYNASEALDLDVTELTDLAASETSRLRAMLAEACDRLRPGEPVEDVVRDLVADGPTTADDVYAAARTTTEEVRAFATSSGLLPDLGGDVLVGPAPPSRRFAQAMMSWAAPYETDAPSRYYIVPPDESWPVEQQREWLSVFSPTTLPTICVHEVTPGHFTHGRALRTLDSPIRRTLHSGAFVEGWAHHVEEVYAELGFRAEDPRYVIGVCLEALLRATRLAVSVGLHTRAITVADAEEMFIRDAHMQRAAAHGEAMRGTVDAFYGIYTLGKVALRRARERARAAWGPAYDEKRFCLALLALGAPPVGVVEAALLDPGSLPALWQN